MKTEKAYLNFFKPLLDWVMALALFLLLFPLLFMIALVLLIANKGEVFFHQERVGKEEVVFHLIKFKTLSAPEDLGGPPRVSLLGGILRKSSIDELPQLLNVLRGQMSLVGPRPLLVEYLPYYNHAEKRRHHVRPGITGWAQINGRNRAGWDQRMQDDLHYVDNISLWLDLKILFLTVIQLFKWKQADFIAVDQETFTAYVKRTRSSQ